MTTVQTALVSVARVFLTCRCGADLPSPSGEADWTLGEVLEAKGQNGEALVCPECGQVLSVTLPDYVPCNP